MCEAVVGPLSGLAVVAPDGPRGLHTNGGEGDDQEVEEVGVVDVVVIVML